MDDHDRLRQGRPRAVESRFELAAVRLAERWLAAGRVTVSSDDLRIARDFLEQVGCNVRELPGVLVRSRTRGPRRTDVARGRPAGGASSPGSAAPGGARRSAPPLTRGATRTRVTRRRHAPWCTCAVWLGSTAARAGSSRGIPLDRCCEMAPSAGCRPRLAARQPQRSPRAPHRRAHVPEPAVTRPVLLQPEGIAALAERVAHLGGRNRSFLAACESALTFAEGLLEAVEVAALRGAQEAGVALVAAVPREQGAARADATDAVLSGTGCVRHAAGPVVDVDAAVGRSDPGCRWYTGRSRCTGRPPAGR